MSLFEDASLVITPNGTKAGKLYAVKPTDGSGDLTVTRATSATRVNASGVIETVSANVPRLDYTNSTCPSILVEGQRTNFITYSEQFNNAVWGAFGSSITANTTISPSGVQDAETITTNTDNSTHGIFQQITTGSSIYTASAYFKANGYNYACIRIATNSDATRYAVVISLLDGSITSTDTSGSPTNTSYKVEYLENGWYRLSVSCNHSSGFIYHTVGISNVAVPTFSNSLPSFIGNGTSGVFIWGAQLEVGSYATSYIPTTSASVTRNADVISKTGISSLIGQTEGTLYTEIKVSKLIGTASRYIFHLSDGTANNRIYIAFSGASSNVLRARIFNGGTLQCSINTSAITTTGTYKLALAYKNNDIVFYVNGVQIGTDTSATIPTCSRVDLGHNYSGVSQFGDSINNSNIWKTRLTNSQLAQLTTI